MTNKHDREFSRRTFVKSASVGLLALGLSAPAIARQRELKIITERTNAGTREKFAEIVAAFQKETGIAVTVNNMDHEAHKTAIRNYLVTSPPDVCFWFSGNRMRKFVERGLFEDITDVLDRDGLRAALGVVANATIVNGRAWGLPTYGNYWGLYYRKDVFAEYGLSVPKTFDDLKAMAIKAKSAGLVPFTLGTKELWPASCWFDSLNLRINGLDKHMALMDGKMRYTDAAIISVFEHWAELIKAGYFLDNASSYSWQQAATFLARKKAAMIHIGQFVQGTVPEADQGQLAVAPFPEVVPGMAQYDDVSFNSVHVPSGAKNKPEAKEFLAFMFQPDQLTKYLAPEGRLPPRADCMVDTPLMESVTAAMKTLKGTAQFYDRDTDPDMAQIGQNGFQEFVAAPERRDAILDRLEKARVRVFEKT